jgi:hypothetical protein
MIIATVIEEQQVYSTLYMEFLQLGSIFAVTKSALGGTSWRFFDSDERAEAEQYFREQAKEETEQEKERERKWEHYKATNQGD